MNPKSMLRRTLAMLLVLIFALSNMGLAEMADAIADGIPAQEPQIEEIAGEAAPVAEQAEEAAPAEEQAAAAEEAPVEDEASEEAEAPAQEAPVVTVEAYAIDEQSIFADAAAEGYDGEIAYQWEVADGEEWIAIEGATDATYTGNMAEMAGQTYRCVVTAGETTAASEGVVSDPSIFGVELSEAEPIAMMGDAIEIAPVNANGLKFKVTASSQVLSMDASSEDGDPDGYYVVAGESVKIDITNWVAGHTDNWEKTSDKDTNNLCAALDDSDDDGSLTISITNNGGATAEAPGILTIKATVNGESLNDDGTVKLYVLPNTPTGATGISLAAKEDSKSAVHKTETGYDVLKGSTIIPSLEGETKYTPIFDVYDNAGSTSQTTSTSTFTVAAEDKGFTESTATAGQTYTVKAKFRGCGDSNPVSTTIKVLEPLSSVTSQVTGGNLKQWVATDTSEGQAVALTFNSESANVYQHAITGITWAITKGEGDDVTAEQAPFEFVQQGDSLTSWKVRLKANAQMPGTVTEYTVKPSTTGVEQTDATGFKVKVYPNLSEDDLKKMVSLTGTAGVKQNADKTGYEIRQNADESDTDVTVSVTNGGDSGLADYVSEVKLAIKDSESTPVTGADGAWIDATGLTNKSFKVKKYDTAGQTNKIEAEGGKSFTLTASVGDTSVEIPFVVQPAATEVAMAVAIDGKPVAGEEETATYVKQEIVVNATAKSENAGEGVTPWLNGLTLTVKNGEGLRSHVTNDNQTYTYKNEKLTFLKADKYQVTAAAHGYSGLSATPVTFKVQALPTQEQFAFDDATTEKTVLVGPGDTITLTVDATKLGQADPTTADDNVGVYTNYTWSIDDKANTLGSTTFVKEAEGTNKAAGTVVYEVNSGVKTASGEIAVTVTSLGLNAEGELGKVEATHKFKVVPKATTITPENIDFPSEIPMPKTGEKTSADEDWQKFTELKLKGDVADYPVTWELVEPDPDNADETGYKDAGTKYDDYVKLSEDGKSLKLQPYSGKEKQLFDAYKNGYVFYIRATIETDKDKNTKSAVKRVTIKPEPAKIDIQMRATANGTPETVETAHTNVPVGDTVILSAALVGPSYTDDSDPQKTVTISPYGSVNNVEWTVRRRTKKQDMTADPQIKADEFELYELPGNTTGTTKTLPTTDVNYFTVEVKGETGVEAEIDETKQFVFDVQQRIKSAKLLLGGEDRNYVNVGSTTKFELELVGTDGTANDLYTDNISWTIGTGFDTDHVKFTSDAEGEEALKTKDNTYYEIPRGSTAFYMVVDGAAEPTTTPVSITAVDNTKTSADRYTPRSGTTATQRVSIRAALADKPFVAAEGKGDDTILTIARDEAGQNSTVKATLNKESIAKLQAAGVDWKYEIKPDSTDSQIGELAKEEAISKWVTIDNNGLITIKPQETGSKPANKINGESVKFTVQVVVLGYETSTDDWMQNIKKELTVYPEARKLDVEGSMRGTEPYAPLPKAIAVGNVIQLKPVAYGLTYDPNDETKVTATPKSAASVKLTVSGGSGVMTSKNNDDGTVTVTAGNRNGLITITARTEDKIGTQLSSDTFEIEVIKETVTAENGGACKDGGAHSWELAPATEQTDPAGHFYYCSVCHAKSTTVAHSAQFDVVVPDDAKDDYDPRVFGEEGDSITCAYCGFVCHHEGYEKNATGLKRVDNTSYHIGTCPTCHEEIKQEHVDDNYDTVCDVCGATGAIAKFVDGDKNELKEIVLPVGKEADPTLTVDNVKSWSVSYTTDDAQEQYVQLVDATEGTIKGVALLPESGSRKTVTLTANIVVYTETENGTLKEEKITKSIPVRVTADPATVTVTAEGGKDYVMYDANQGTNGKALLKLTAKADIANPDWTHYQWKVSATKSELDADGNEKESIPDPKSYFTFYTKDKESKYNSADPASIHDPEVYVGVAAGKGNAGDINPVGRLLISFEYEPQETDTADKATKFEPVQIDALPALGNATLEDHLALSKDKVVQGDTITVDESKVDSRYGTIEYSFQVDKNSDVSGATETLLSKWASVSGNTITVKPAALENKLSESKTTQKMVVTAEIKLPDASGKPGVKATYDMPFTIVQKPDHVKIMYATAGDDGALGDWADINKATNLSCLVGDSIFLTAEFYDKDDKKITGEDALDGKSITWTWPAESVVKVENVKSDGTSSDDVTGYYKLTFQAAAGSKNVPIVAGNAIKDVTANIPVKPLIEKIELSANTDIFVPGESVFDGVETTTKEVLIDYTITPSDSTDTLVWHVVNRDTKDEETNVEIDPVEGTKQARVSVPGNIDKKLSLTIYATSAKGEVVEGADAPVLAESNELQLTIYKPADEYALLLETEPAGRSSMSVGETMPIVKHEYDINNGYNSTIPLGDIIVTDEQDEKGAAMADGTHVLTVDPETFVITALNPGKATIELHAYNWADNKSSMASRTITVEAAATDIQFGTAINDPAEYDITVGKRPYPSFRTTDFTAVRAVDGDETATPTPVRSALVELVSTNEDIVKVVKTATGWQLEPVAGGEAIVNAKVGAVEKPITVRVMDAINDIQFYVNGTAVTGNQYPVLVGADPVTVTWKAIPENTDPDQVITVTADSADAVVNADNVVVTPKTAGTITINAQTTNKDYVSGTDAANNQQYLKRHLEIVVTAEEITPPPVQGDYNIEIIGKKAIGPSESTDVALLGVADEDASRVTWAITDGSATVEGTGTQAKVIGGETAGLATVAASLDGTVLATEEINVLTAITKITFNETNSYALNKDESVKLVPEIEGYTSVVAEGEDPDLSGIISYTMNAADTAYVRVDYDADGNAYVVGVKQNTKNKTTKEQPYPITAKAYNSVTATINVTMKSNKVNTGFSIPQNGTEIKMVAGDSMTVIPTWIPAKTPAVLNWDIEPNDDGLELSGTDEATTITVTEGASESYTVTVTEAGYPDRPAQSFTIDVVEKADTDATIAYTKVGVSGDPKPASDLTLAVGERIQAVLMNGEEIVAGTGWASSKPKQVSVDAATGVVTVLKANAKPVTITAPNQKTFTVKGIKATGKFTFSAPTTVGVGEKFDITYAFSNYKGTDTCLTDIIVSNDAMGFAKDETGKYSFDEPGIVTLTGNTTFGQTPKTVTIEIKPAPTVDALEITGPTTIAKGRTIHLRVALNDEADAESFANITWTVGGNPVNSATKATKTGVANITAKLVSNNEIEITASSKAKEGSIAVTAAAAGYDMTAESFTLTAANADATIAGGMIVFDKPVIAVGETTYAKIVNAEGEEVGGKVTYTSSDKKSLTISGNKLTAKKPGAVTVTAKAGGEITGTLYIATAPDVVMNNKPAKLAAGSEAHVALTIRGYATTGMTLGDDITATTEGILTATSNNAGLVEASIIPNEDIEPAEDGDGVIRDYTLVLKAANKVETTKNKYPSATVTVSLLGKKFQSMKVQVVSATKESELRFPKEIWIEPGKTMSLTPSTGDANEAGVIDWQFVEGKQAAGMSFTKDGKLTVAKKTPAGGVSELIGTAGEATFKLTAHIGQKVTNKNQFKIDAPKTQIGVGEKMLMGVTFTSPYGGVVTWTSSNTKIASVDKVTGLVVGKQDSNGKTVTIKAKVNGKTQSTKITVGGAPTKVEFSPSEYTVTELGKEVPIKVVLTGGSVAQDVSKESAYIIELGDNDSGLIDMENSDLAAGKVVTSTTAEEGSKATLKVTTYNGLTATCMIVYGVTAGGSTGPVTPSTQKLDSVKLWLDGYELTTTQQNPLVMVEDQKITPNVIAKDDKGVEIPASAYTLTWDVKDEASKKNVEIAADGTLTAKLFTTNGATDALVTVIATVAVGEDTKTAEYYVSIEPKFSDSHLQFEVKDNKYSPVVDSPVTATLKFDNSSYNDLLQDVEVRSSNPEILEATLTESKATEMVYTLSPRKAGAAKIIITYTDDNDVTITKEEDFTVLDKPTSEQLSLEPASVMSGVTLVVGERMDVSTVLDASFTGTQTANDFKYQFVNKSGALVGTASDIVSVENKPLSDSSEEYAVGQFVIKAEEKGEAYIQFVAFDKAKQTIKVTVLGKPNVSVDMTPKKNKDIKEDGFMAGKGETVTLTLKQVQDTGHKGDAEYASSYTQGLEWVVAAPLPSDSDQNAPKVELVPAEDNMSAQVTFDGVDYVTIDLKCKGASDSDLPVHSVTINYTDVPTSEDDIANTQITTKSALTLDNKFVFEPPVDNVYKIGVGETVVASFEFNTAVYANGITWETVGTKVGLKYSDDFTKCEITGLEETSANSSVTVTAKYKTVTLATFKIAVLPAPNKIDLMVGTGANAEAFKYNVTTSMTLSAKLDPSTAMADCQLTSDNSNLKFKQTSATTWTAIRSGTGTATVTLKTSTGLIKRYTVTFAN